MLALRDGTGDGDARDGCGGYSVCLGIIWNEFVAELAVGRFSGKNGKVDVNGAVQAFLEAMLNVSHVSVWGTMCK